MFQDGVELNWLPPTEPNGEVHYVVEYKREDSGSWTSVNTTSDSTHYNLTGLHSGTNYTIRVVAVNSAGRAPITPTPTSSTAEPTPTFNNTGEDDKRDRRGGRERRMTAHIHEVVECCLAWQSRRHTVAHVTLCILSSINTTCYSLHSPCFTGGALNLPAVLAGAVVAFLLLTLLIAGIIVGVVLLRRGIKRKEKTLKKGHWIEEIECTENSTELTGRDQESAVGHSEQWADEAAFHYEQDVADMHYESTDFDGEGCCGREDGNAIRSERNQSDGIGAAENTPMKEELGNIIVSNGQQNDQPKGTPDAVYAVVDKSKKKKQGKTQGGASATTTQGADTEEQHYECSDVVGQDWLGNVVGEKLEEGDFAQGSHFNVAKKTIHSLNTATHVQRKKI